MLEEGSGTGRNIRNGHGNAINRQVSVVFLCSFIYYVIPCNKVECAAQLRGVPVCAAFGIYLSIYQC